MMDKIDNWKAATESARLGRNPLVIMIDQEDCPYCRIVEGEFFSAILASGEFDGKVIFGKISLDAGEFITLPDGNRVSTWDFLQPFFTAGLTPTVIFLDPDGNELVERMVGLSTPDFYGFYLERSIRKARALLNG